MRVNVGQPFHGWCVGGLWLLAGIWGVHAVAQDAGSEFFEARIRPVLVEACYECHNSQRREGGLALDWRDALRQGGERQRELAEQGSRRNLVLEAMRHDHDDLKMPEGGAKLSPQVIADFEKWFASGAIDPRVEPPRPEESEPKQLRALIFAERAKWWALQPLGKYPPPDLASGAGPHAIDAFIDAALRQRGLSRAPMADRGVLLRRLSYALTGLPPTSQELAELENSPHAHVIPMAIGRLLESPRFGEHWARHWMDWLRYADSHGSEGDPAIPYAFQYRDYLIRALNADVPYDRLVQEHIAGDLLQPPRINESLGINESAIGPGHLRMVFHGFAPTDALDEKVRFVDDQIAAVTKGFLGLTVACARCHDHKFDSIRQRDYYALFGIFGSCHPGIVDVNLPERQLAGQADMTELKPLIRHAMAEQWLAAIDSIFEQVFHPNPQQLRTVSAATEAEPALYLWRMLLEQQAETPLDQPVSQSVWQLLRRYREQSRELSAALDLPTTASESAKTVADLSRWYAHGNGTVRIASVDGEFTIASSGAHAIEAIMPAGHYSHLLSQRHRNVWQSPRFHLDQPYELWLLVAGDGDASVRYAVQDYPRNGTVYPVTGLNKARAWRWQKYDLDYWQGELLHIELATAGDAPVLAKNVERSWFGLRAARLLPKGHAPLPSPAVEAVSELVNACLQAENGSWRELRQSAQQAFRQTVVAWQAGQATVAQAAWLNAWLQAGLLPDAEQSQASEVSVASKDQPQSLAALLRKYRQLDKQIPLPVRVPGVLETSGADQSLFERGDHRQPRDPVSRGFLSVFHAAPYRAADSGRLELAASLTQASRSLLARVIVNRVWHHLFGRGLVATPDNFGKLGIAPSHPELLDYLAQDFIANGWSLKKLIGKIVSSQTWMQVSTVSPQARELDPDNLWWSRASVRRLEAEAIRDAQLVVSGRLDSTMFGPAVDSSTSRRSLYLRVFRNSLDPQLRAFDFPEPSSTVGQRDVTNVPAQALLLMNNPRVRESATAWAQRLEQYAASHAAGAAIEQMFISALGRRPLLAETQQVRQQYQAIFDNLRERQLQRDGLVAQQQETLVSLNKLLDTARQRLRQRKAGAVDGAAPSVAPVAAPLVQPVASWEFERPEDQVRGIGGELIGQARLEQGLLVTEGGHFQSAALPFPLAEKTLEVWLSVADLGQRGGGAMSVQTANGITFDAIVLGEQAPGEWLAGSNNFARTKPFSGQQETQPQTPIHLAITYDSDGRITGYRNGRPYGASYVSSALQKYTAGETVVTFGCRHLPAGGNRQLVAKWERARLYDRALTPEEIAASYASQPHAPSMEEVRGELSLAQRATVTQLEARLDALRTQAVALGLPSGASAQSGSTGGESLEVQAWTEIVLAVFSAKEFIFVK